PRSTITAARSTSIPATRVPPLTRLKFRSLQRFPHWWFAILIPSFPSLKQNERAKGSKAYMVKIPLVFRGCAAFSSGVVGVCARRVCAEQNAINTAETIRKVFFMKCAPQNQEFRKQLPGSHAS